MVNINQPKKIDEGSNWGSLGQILGAGLGAALAIPTGGLSVAGAGTAIAGGAGLGSTLGGAAGAMASKPGSVTEAPTVQNSGQGSAMARRLLDSPSMPIQAQVDPGLEALRRRYGMVG